MKFAFVWLVTVVVVCQIHAQNSPTVDGLRPTTVAELSRISPWPRISAPPRASDSVHSHEGWAQQAALLRQTLDIVRHEWTGDVASGGYDLRMRVTQYEELIRKMTQSGGYGSMVLADCLRRLSQYALVQYLITYPAEYSVVDDLLKQNRVRLLDSAAVRHILSEEPGLDELSGQERLSERQADVARIFEHLGSSYRKEVGRILLGVPSVSGLLNRRDSSGLLLRLMTSDSIEQVHLPGLVKFLSKGGALRDIRTDNTGSFLRIMEQEEKAFQFPALGINMLRAGHLSALLQAFEPGGARVSFATIVAE